MLKWVVVVVEGQLRQIQNLNLLHVNGAVHHAFATKLPINQSIFPNLNQKCGKKSANL